MQRRRDWTFNVTLFMSQLALGLFAAGMLAFSAFAAPLLPGSALESPVGHFLLGETAQGVELISQVLGQSSTVEEFLTHLRQPRMSRLREELEARIGRIRESLHDAAVERNGGRDTHEADAFTADERMVLREVASRELSIEQSWGSLDPRAGEIKFAASPDTGDLSANRETFLDQVGDDGGSPLRSDSSDRVTSEVREKAKRDLWDWYKESKDCLDRRPDRDNRSIEIRNLIEQMTISAGVTTVGTLVRTGISHFDLRAYSVDLFMSLLSQGVSMSWMKNRDTFEMRWLKVFTWGHLRADLDAEVYRITPWTDTHGVPMDEAVHERRDFSVDWNAKTSWISPLMFTVLNGAECLISEGHGVKNPANAAAAAKKFARGAYFFKLGVSVNNSILFYRWRSQKVRANAIPH